MGEAGVFSREAFFYDVDHWEVVAAVRGYRKRQEALIHFGRLNTWLMLMPHVEQHSPLRNSPAELYRLPSDDREEDDDEERDEPSEEEVERLTRMIERANEER